MRNYKRYKMMMFLVVFFLGITTRVVYAEEGVKSNITITEEKSSPINLTQEETKELEGLYEYINNMKNEYEILKDLDPKTYISKFMKDGEGGITFKEVFKYFSRYMVKEVKATFQFLTILIVIALVSSLLKNLQEAFQSGEVSNVAYLACYAIIIIVLSKSFFMGVDLARATINNVTNFITILVPVLMMLLVSMGGITQVALMDPVIMTISGLGSKIITDIVFPIIIMSFVLNFVNNLCDDTKIEKLSKLLKSGVLWGVGTIMTLFVTILTIRGISSRGIDEITMKTAKFAVDNFIPVVGKTLSDAISTVAGYTGILKNAIGTMGLLVIIVIGVFPILKLAIMAISYKLTAAIIEPISDKKIVNCISSAGDSIGLIIACVISVSIMCFIMICIITAATAPAMV